MTLLPFQVKDTYDKTKRNRVNVLRKVLGIERRGLRGIVETRLRMSQLCRRGTIMSLLY